MTVILPEKLNFDVYIIVGYFLYVLEQHKAESDFMPLDKDKFLNDVKYEYDYSDEEFSEIYKLIIDDDVFEVVDDTIKLTKNGLNRYLYTLTFVV